MDQINFPILEIGFILTIIIVPCFALVTLVLSVIADKVKGFLLHLSLFAFYLLLFIVDIFILLDIPCFMNYFWPLYLGLFLLPGSIPYSIVLFFCKRQKKSWHIAASICGLLTTLFATIGICLICHFARFVG